jgi:hypothetical protein
MLNNDGVIGSCIFAVDSKLTIFGCSIRNGFFAGVTAFSCCVLCACTLIRDNDGHGIFMSEGEAIIEDSSISCNKNDGLCLNGDMVVIVKECKLKNNSKGDCSSDQKCLVHFLDCFV